MRIPNKTVAVFSSKGCAEEHSATEGFREGAHTAGFSRYQSEYLPVFYSFPNGCCLLSTGLWKTDKETVEDTAFFRGILLWKKALVCRKENTGHRLESCRTMSFFMQDTCGNKSFTIILQTEKRKRDARKNKNMVERIFYFKFWHPADGNRKLLL